MKYTPYSFSKINTFYQCKYKFKLQYIDKVKVVPIPKEYFDRGKFLHLLFEYDGNMENIVKTKDFSEIWDHKLLNVQDFIHYRKIYKKFKESKFGKTLLDNKLFVEYHIELTGKEIGFENESGVVFRGYIDGIFKGKNNQIIITDWKTGMYKKRDFKQLLYYSIFLLEKTDIQEVIMLYVYPEHNKADKNVAKKKDLDKYKNLLKNDIISIESCETFDKNIDTHCTECDFVDVCNPFCENGE